MRTRGFAAAALAASLLLVPAAGPASAAGSGMVPRGQVAWADLGRPVAVVAARSGGAGAVAVAEGVTGFPVSASTTGATGTAGAVPAGSCLGLEVHGQQVASGRADDHGRFSLAGAVPAGAVATVWWAPCGTGGEAGRRDCRNGQVHAGNPNRDEAASHSDRGCAAQGDAGPRS